MSKPSLLVLSHVLPFPGTAGQQQRVRYTLETAADFFDVDFFTFAPAAMTSRVEQELKGLCRRAFVQPSAQAVESFPRLLQRLRCGLFMARTGLKSSNFIVGQIEFSPQRICRVLDPATYSCVLFEYFHAATSTRLFREAAVPTVLDMHNVLWKSFEIRQAQRGLPEPIRKLNLSRYRQQEELAWTKFDALIAINRREHDMVRSRLSPGQRLFYVPMGVDLTKWPMTWAPATPARIVYYGGLGSPHNAAAALYCFERIMPKIWERYPKAELWIVGSNPPQRLKDLGSDARVRVTGFVESAAAILRAASLVLCPWSGTYGFRSRLVEVMALGVPVVASPEAVDGMDFQDEQGIFLCPDDASLIVRTLHLLSDRGFACDQSLRARKAAEQYSIDYNYRAFFPELISWLQTRNLHAPRGAFA